LPRLEQLEIEAHRGEIARGVRHLFESIAPLSIKTCDVDQTAADRLILTEVATAVDALENELLNQ
jgi:hypothetical protein